jgi:hypothetical protein
MNLYHAFVERVSAFAAWLLTLSAAMWPPVGRALTHHRERGMEYQRDSRSFDANQNHQKYQKSFPQASHTVPMARMGASQCGNDRPGFGLPSITPGIAGYNIIRVLNIIKLKLYNII